MSYNPKAKEVLDKMRDCIEAEEIKKYETKLKEIISLTQHLCAEDLVRLYEELDRFLDINPESEASKL